VYKFKEKNKYAAFPLPSKESYFRRVVFAQIRRGAKLLLLANTSFDLAMELSVGS